MNEEIDWEKEITQAASDSELSPREQRMTELESEVQRLLQVFGIEDILQGIKSQILPEGEIVIKKKHPRLKVIDHRDFRFSMCQGTPIGYTKTMSLRSDMTIKVFGTSRAVYHGPTGEETFDHWEDIPGYTCEGHHFLDVSMYAGFEDIDKTEFHTKKGGVDEYLRNKELKKEGLIKAGFRITPVEDSDKHATLDKHGDFFTKYFDWGHFSMTEIREGLIKAIARYLSSANLNNTTLDRRSP